MTEEEIIKGCIQKKLSCQHILFKKYAGRLMTICHRYATDVPEAEDMLQEGFIRVFCWVCPKKSVVDDGDICPTTGEHHLPHRAFWHEGKLYFNGNVVMEKEVLA